MKVAKEYKEVKRINYKPEIEECVKCGSGLKRSHIVKRKVVVTLERVIGIVSWGYKCEKGCDVVYKSAEAEGLSLKYYTYGLDVIVEIGRKRFREGKTEGEIYEEIRGIGISKREIGYLIEVYLGLVECARGGGITEEGREEIENNGGIILSIDGVGGEKGNETFYIFRDVMSGVVLHTANLMNAGEEEMKGELREIEGLGFKVLGVISDSEEAIKGAVKEIFPGVVHQLCQTHFLMAIQKPINEEDIQLRKGLKKQLKKVKEVEKELNKIVDEAKGEKEKKEVVEGYTAAIRSAITKKSKRPFKLAGLEIYKDMERIESSLKRSLQKQRDPQLEKIKGVLESREQFADKKERIDRQQGYIYQIAKILDPKKTEDDKWVKTASEVKKEMKVYLEELSNRKADFPEDASLIDHIINRTQSWGDGLYHCYDVEGLPRTNNDMETYIGSLKRKQRRLRGRKTCQDYFLRYGSCIVFTEEEKTSQELLESFRTVTPTAFRKAREKLRQTQKLQKQIRSYRRDPDRYLSALENLWFDSS